MKLRNKLIPLASCLATVATVAPVSLTACTNAGWTDLKDGFTPSFSRLAVEGNKLDTKTGEQVYFNAISENPEIFAQDYNWTMSLALRAAADNPNYLLEDTNTSLLDSAKQSVTDIRVGKTVINHKDSTGASIDEEFYTLSFKYSREQQYTYDYFEDVSGGESHIKMVGLTTYSMEFENVPMNFYLNYYRGTISSALGTDGDAKKISNYSGHLGRGLFEYYDNMIYYLYNHTDWLLSPAIIINMPSGTTNAQRSALVHMTDPWSINYSIKTSDTKYNTYNDVTSEHEYGGSMSGAFNNSTLESEMSSEAISAMYELAYFTSGSFYMSDITNSDISK